jgi:hypothetical protein
MGLIVYLLDQPLDSRNRKRFGIQSWLNKGWTVEVWDLTPWIYPGVWAAFTGTQSWRASSFPECITVVSKAALLRLSQRRPALYIDETGDSYPALYARLFLRRRGASRVVCNLGVLPGYSDAKNTLVAKLQRAISKGPARMLNLIHRSLLRTLAARLCKPDVMVISGERSKPSVRHRAEIIWTHNFDYDIYLSQKTLVDTPAEEGYAVFIDQDYCFHSDFLGQGVLSFMTPEKYFPVLCAGLREIADALKVNVRIAAHPRSSYQQKTANPFGDFPVEYGRTADLIRNCKVVVSHDSTAIQFAVLFGKPVIFVTTDQLIPENEGKAINSIAAELGKAAINLDGDLRDIDWLAELRVDVEKYAAYRRNYIKRDASPDIPLWDIVIGQLAKPLGSPRSVGT